MTPTEVDPVPVQEKPRGSVGRVAMKVRALRRVIQSRGVFEVCGEYGAPPYAAAIAPPEWKAEQKGDVLHVWGQFSFKGVRNYQGLEGVPLSDDANTFVRVDAAFVAEYELEDSQPLDALDIDEFAAVNGNLNIHPFWREYVLNCLSRASLPPLSLPVFNPVKLGLVKPELAKK